MSEMTQYNPGTFCWVDLGTTDTAAAKQFYSELFSWKSNDIPAGEDNVYTIMQMDEKEVAALYALEPQQLSEGVFPSWMNYISVSNVDETAKKAESLGGKIVMASMDVMEAGRMAVLKDPVGAVFALWEPRKHIGAQLVNEPNSLCWNELYTDDIEACSKFYTELFGWSTDVQEMESMNYTVFMNGERSMGGMLQIPEEWGEVPPQWLAYFAVDNCESIVEKAKANGAAVQVPPTDIPEIGRFAILRDPQGASFSIIHLLNPS